MTKILISEGSTDAIVLRTILAAAGLNQVQTLAGGGKSPAISLGTSFALNRSARVAIVVDADTTDLNRVDEQQLIFKDLIRHSPGSGSCELFLAVPTLEGAIFPTAQAFASTFGLTITPRQEERYRKNWSSVVCSFLTIPATDASVMIKTHRLSPSALRSLFKKPLLRNLKHYFEQS
jgi:hypothetical protein